MVSDRGDDADRSGGRRSDPVTPGGGGPDHARGIGEQPDGVDSEWWYWVAAVPAYWVVGSAVGVAFAAVVGVLLVTGVVAGGPAVRVSAGFGVVSLALVVVAVLLAFVGMIVSLVFPVAVFRDAEAVAAVRGDWQPDPASYGLVGLVGVVVQPLQVALAVYYLYKRHESVGRP
ncbi:hypothetical protein KI372_09495 [Halobacterium salinarum]|uniref:hypothetical protein n=1 Tax=Halobacterium salinarum TaxID=2242 RepID=UPI001F3BBCE2|nr:hypothetical protein [Halobacterium salinarum]MCF2207192.1 hypothetical protein [Halobacterium salinarum]MCF2241581.1 hypothetical protein [Halobacterium salinarum]